MALRDTGLDGERELAGAAAAAPGAQQGAEAVGAGGDGGKGCIDHGRETSTRRPPADYLPHNWGYACGYAGGPFAASRLIFFASDHLWTSVGPS